MPGMVWADMSISRSLSCAAAGPVEVRTDAANSAAAMKYKKLFRTHHLLAGSIAYRVSPRESERIADRGLKLGRYSAAALRLTGVYTRRGVISGGSPEEVGNSTRLWREEFTIKAFGKWVPGVVPAK